MPDEHRITWIRVGERYPDLKGERNHFLALDGEDVVGVLKLITAGADARRWLWSMTLVHPGPPLNVPRSCPTGREAAQALAHCWRAFRK